MLTPPDAGVPRATLIAALERAWGMAVASIEYRPVGWGSHHWEATDTSGSRWFVTADELANKTLSESEPVTAAYGRLRASLAAARALRDAGHPFVVAPVPSRDGEPVVRVADGFGVTVYPFVEGRSFQWGDSLSPAHRLGILELLVAVHSFSGGARRDDFTIPHRDELAGEGVRDCGPYARPVSDLLVRHAAPLGRLLARYDAGVLDARADAARAVLTHGEPHPGNAMLTAGGWKLIDWDTVLIAPPERDLWLIDPGDGSILAAYAAATGVQPRPALLDLYRLRWDLADVAVDVSRFRRPHAGTSEDAKSWDLLTSLVERLTSVALSGLLTEDPCLTEEKVSGMTHYFPSSTDLPRKTGSAGRWSAEIGAKKHDCRAGCPAARSSAAGMRAPRSQRQASAGLSPHRAPTSMVFPAVELVMIRYKNEKAAVSMS